jgi:hypothetical protein
MTTALLVSATTAAPQTVSPSHGHEQGSSAARVHPEATHGMQSNVMEQISALDNRINVLSADMRKLSGERKIDAMAALLTAMLERQSLMESGMKTMRERMMSRMTESREPPADSPEEEPGGMCSPSN